MSSPTVRRWELGQALRTIRESGGHRIEEVAAALGCSTSKVSRLETAARGASLKDVRDLCDFYAVDPEGRERLLGLVREARQPGWWQAYDEVASRGGTYLGLEEAASSITCYQTIRIPGLLQTPEYAAALLRRLVPNFPADAVPQVVDARRERQRLLAKEPRLDYWVILDEAVLHRQVGGPAVLRAQLHHLVELVEEGRLTIQVITFESGAHAGMDGSFTVLRFPQNSMSDVIYVEARSGQLFLTRPGELAVYRETLDHLRATAESPDRSLGLIRRAASA